MSPGANEPTPDGVPVNIKSFSYEVRSALGFGNRYRWMECYLQCHDRRNMLDQPRNLEDHIGRDAVLLNLPIHLS